MIWSGFVQKLSWLVLLWSSPALALLQRHPSSSASSSPWNGVQARGGDNRHSPSIDFQSYRQQQLQREERARRARQTALASASSSSSPSPNQRDASSSTSTQHEQQEQDQSTPNGSDSSSTINLEKNNQYIHGLLDNLNSALDRYILRGSHQSKLQACNIWTMIESQAQNDDLKQRATRMVQRAGLSIPESEYQNSANDKELGTNDAAKRQKEAEQRRHWEEERLRKEQQEQQKQQTPRSALSRRANASGKPDLFMGQVGLDPIAKLASDKADLENALNGGDDKENEASSSNPQTPPTTPSSTINNTPPSVDDAAIARVSQLVAQAGAATGFEGQHLGIGGLDDVLAEVKRRVWTPLAAPPALLRELGICPVRGLLLYGRPGCGKTLLARKLGQILSPLRPITVVSGPEVLDKFVGSSEKNLRELFDNPPDIYDFFRIGEPDGGDAIAKAALHVVVMDEFDSIARVRGGRGGKGDQGDAGVARDSVVNQLLAKMDGVEPLTVPTMVIGLTNKRSLIDPALLRPGRFEVQVEVPPPRTTEQRVSILKVHTSIMQEAGRLLVSDAPPNSPATRQSADPETIPTYEELLRSLAEECTGFSGASLAGVTRAAASHALERAVDDFMHHAAAASPDTSSTPNDLNDCVVLQEDFDAAIQDIKSGMGESDYSEEPTEDEDPPANGANAENIESSKDNENLDDDMAP